MRATIIVRHLSSQNIAHLVEASSLDESTVNQLVEGLERRYPREGYRIDLSQVMMAREAQRLAA